MNRKQRRTLARGINRIDDSDFKRRLFHSVLISSNDENEKVLNMQGALSERIYGAFFPKTVKKLGACVPAMNQCH